MNQTVSCETLDLKRAGAFLSGIVETVQGGFMQGPVVFWVFAAVAAQGISVRQRIKISPRRDLLSGGVKSRPCRIRQADTLCDLARGRRSRDDRELSSRSLVARSVEPMKSVLSCSCRSFENEQE